jgi:hypothetical protein
MNMTPEMEAQLFDDEEEEDMPVRKTKNGKWTFGGAEYDTKKDAEKAYRAYLAKKHSKKGKK